jgi:hypothetical protein
MGYKHLAPTVLAGLPIQSARNLFDRPGARLNLPAWIIHPVF